MDVDFILLACLSFQLQRENKDAERLAKKHRMVGEGLNWAVGVRSWFEIETLLMLIRNLSKKQVPPPLQSKIRSNPPSISISVQIQILRRDGFRSVSKNILSFSTSIRHADRRIKCGPNYGYSSRNWICDDRHWWSDDLIFSVILPFQSSLITFSCQALVVVQWRQRNLSLKVFCMFRVF